MTGTPVRFKRVAAAFNEAYSLVRLCESSGSEHDPLDHEERDLSVLVNSFIERECVVKEKKENVDDEEENDKGCNSFDETKQSLGDLLYNFNNKIEDDNGDLDIRRRIREETELACRVVGDRSLSGFKRRLMSCLRARGFDAGLCKSRWERSVKHPGGDYEYIDININESRYIVEVLLSDEFKIARASSQYSELLDVFPRIYVGKPDELKRIVKIMCRAIRESMKGIDMYVPPWRRHRYMQAKWFGCYKRTVNENPTKTKEQKSDPAVKCSIGLETFRVKAYHCREDFASEHGPKVGYLTTILDGNGINI